MPDQDISLSPSPFDKSIYAPTGNPVAGDIFYAVGYALSQWEHAEVLLGTMFSILMRPTGGTHIPLRAFGGISSSGSRRELIEHGAEAYFAILLYGCDEGTVAKGNELHKEIRKYLRLFGDASRRRDEIAHGVVMSEPITPSHPTPIYFLVPAFYASRKTEVLPPFKPDYRLSATELNDYAQLFGLLFTRASELNLQISNFYLSLPEKSRALHP